MLRIGLMIESSDPPRWIRATGEAIAQSGIAVIVATVVSRNGKKDLSWLTCSPRLKPFRLDQFYSCLDYWYFDSPPDALEGGPIPEELKDGLILNVEPIWNDTCFSLSLEDQALLREVNMDVLLLFWPGKPNQEVLALARYGVWFFGDPEVPLGQEPRTGFAEVLNQEAVEHCLECLRVGPAKPLVLHRYYAPIHPYSIRITRNNLLWKSGSIVCRKLIELHGCGSVDAIAQGHCNNTSRRVKAASHCATNKILYHIWRFVLDRVVDRLCTDQWMIGFTFASGEHILDHDFSRFKWLVPPKDRYWADPFPVASGSDYFLFFEEFVYSEKHGHLCVAAIDRKGLVEPPKRILQHKYHLSYPFVFSWKGQWYLIPETQEAGEIDVYRFDSFPYKPTYCGTLMTGINAVDTTLFEYHGKWWMFTAIASARTWNVDELFLFFADTPFGPWTPHPKNPIRSDARCARPAGRIFQHDGKYYRPAQDCSYRYGCAIRFQQIKILSEQEYAEEEFDSIVPGWTPGIVASHTFNHAGDVVVIDAQQRRLR